MNCRLVLSDYAKNYLLASSPVLRRQQFLIRSLGLGVGGIKMHNQNSVEADSETILRAITPSLDLSRHKGQAGRTSC